MLTQVVERMELGEVEEEEDVEGEEKEEDVASGLREMSADEMEVEGGKGCDEAERVEESLDRLIVAMCSRRNLASDVVCGKYDGVNL